jgi:hypothetical protein
VVVWLSCSPVSVAREDDVDPITIGIAIGLVSLLGGTVATAVAGEPEAKDRAHERRQSRRQSRAQELEARAYDERWPVVTSHRGAPRDVSDLEAEAERLRAERAAEHRRWYGEGEG